MQLFSRRKNFFQLSFLHWKSPEKVCFLSYHRKFSKNITFLRGISKKKSFLFWLDFTMLNLKYKHYSKNFEGELKFNEWWGKDKSLFLQSFIKKKIISWILISASNFLKNYQTITKVILHSGNCFLEIPARLSIIDDPGEVKFFHEICITESKMVLDKFRSLWARYIKVKVYIMPCKNKLDRLKKHLLIT